MINAMSSSLTHVVLFCGFSPGYVVKRRLRIRTLQMDVAANFTQLYESADTEVILTVLTHKVLSIISPHAFFCSKTFLFHYDPAFI